jgi:dynamin 1-like protein
MDLLPVGSTMCTRCPLHLELQRTESAEGKPLCQAEFGIFNDSEWKVEKKFKLSHPTPSESEVLAVQAEIERQTVRRAGQGMNVSMDAIHLRVSSPTVPILSLVDLPGLTMTALLDKGQPADIKLQIRNMVKTHIESERAIVLVVMPARPDLEADAALDLVKESDPTGERSVGVLTKVDLMSKGSDICSYLNNQVSSSLRMRFGYFGVKGRSTQEMTDKVTMEEAVRREIEYFDTDEAYANLQARERLGSQALGQALSAHLVEHIRHFLPVIMQELEQRDQQLRQREREVGPGLPDDEAGRWALIHQLLNGLATNFSASINNHTKQLRLLGVSAPRSTARMIRDRFETTRRELQSLNPFSAQDFSDEEIHECVKNIEGNRMSMSGLCGGANIEVLETCLQDASKRPYQVLLPPSVTCAQEILTELRQLVDGLLRSDAFVRFPALAQRLRADVDEQVLYKAYQVSAERIEELIKMEENYIWTEDSDFVNAFRAAIGDSKKGQANFDASATRKLLQAYFATVKRTMANSVPKIIMLHLVERAEHYFVTDLPNLVKDYDLRALMTEADGIEALRKKYVNERRRLDEGRRILSSILSGAPM